MDLSLPHPSVPSSSMDVSPLFSVVHPLGGPVVGQLEAMDLSGLLCGVHLTKWAGGGPTGGDGVFDDRHTFCGFKGCQHTTSERFIL